MSNSNTAAIFRINRMRRSIEHVSVANYSMSLVFATPGEAKYFVGEIDGKPITAANRA